MGKEKGEGRIKERRGNYGGSVVECKKILKIDPAERLYLFERQHLAGADRLGLQPSW